MYSTSNQENTVNQLLYPGFVEEIVDAIRLHDTNSRYAVCFVILSKLFLLIYFIFRNKNMENVDHVLCFL